MDVTRKIVVGVDDSEIGVRALKYALEVAANGPRAEVHAIRVVEIATDPILGVLPPAAPDELTALKELIQKTVQESIAETGALKVSAVVAHVAIGAPGRTIVNLAAEMDADLIVVGTHGRRGLRRALLGSVAEEVVRTAGCPVYAVRAKAHPEEARLPQVEPVCEDCAETRFKTKNAEMWCERHRGRHARAHVYHYEDRSTDPIRPWGFDA